MHQKWSDYALTNLLFGLHRSVWVIDLLNILLNPYPKAPAHLFTLEMLWAKERTLTLHFSVVFTLDSNLNLLRSLGVHNHTLLFHTLLRHFHALLFVLTPCYSRLSPCHCCPTITHPCTLLPCYPPFSRTSYPPPLLFHCLVAHSHVLLLCFVSWYFLLTFLCRWKSLEHHQQASSKFFFS